MDGPDCSDGGFPQVRNFGLFGGRSNFDSLLGLKLLVVIGQEIELSTANHGFFLDFDLGDGWEDVEVNNDPREVREKALKMGANILNYVFNN